jgi:hypothetical protein
MPPMTQANAPIRALRWIRAHPVATLLIGVIAVVMLVAFLEWSCGLGYILQVQSCPVPMANGQLPPEAAAGCNP